MHRFPFLPLLTVPSLTPACSFHASGEAVLRVQAFFFSCVFTAVLTIVKHGVAYPCRLSREIAELREVVRKQKEKIEHCSLHRKFMERVLDYSDEVISSRHCSIICYIGCELL